MRGPDLCPSAHDVTGLPRPIAEDQNGTLRPVPWTQNYNSWGLLDERRSSKCTDEARCPVCGEVVEDGVVMQSVNGIWSSNRQTVLFATMHTLRTTTFIADGGPLHHTCMKITNAHCRSVRNSINAGTFVVRPFFPTEHDEGRPKWLDIDPVDDYSARITPELTGALFA